jgi:WD40 repeat protein
MVFEAATVTRPAIESGWERATARILDSRGEPAGAAFLMPGRLLLTCAHVVSGVLGLPEDQALPLDAEVMVDFPLAARFPGIAGRVLFSMPVAADNTGDIGILRLAGDPPPDAVPLRVVAADDLAGHRWRAFGFPRYRANGETKDAGIWTAGTIRGREGTGWWQLAVDPEEGYSLAEGFSGAAVWDDDYAGVVGVIVAVERDPRRRVGYALTVESVAREWPELRRHLLAGCPYRSLRPFTELDSEVFFGRRHETERLTELVTVESRAIIPVLGASGVGKSSLVRAGLLARLAEDDDSGYVIAHVPHGVRHTAGELLAWALASSGQPDVHGASWQEEWRALAASIAAGVGLAETAEHVLAGHSEGTRLVVVVDQFEGLVSAAPEVAQELDTMLGSITARWPDGTRRVQAVVVSRIDFLQQFSAFPHLNEAWKTTNVVVPPMTREQLSEIITSPLADLKGIRFADGLPEQILHDTPTGPSALPMLEYTLTELWKRQERGIITTAAYREIGGVDGALARSAERALWQRADASERPVIERVLIQMVRPGEQLDAGGRAPDTRRVASCDEFDDQEWRLIHRIATTRLVSITRQPTGPDTAELAHEALLTAWPRLASWVDDNREFRTWQEELRRVIRQWRDHQQDARYLLTEPYITGAVEWMRLRQPELTQAEQEFIRLSVAATARRRRQRRYRFGAVALVVILTLAAGAFAIQQRLSGEVQRADNLSQQIVAEAAGLNSSQPNLAKQLRVAAYQVAHTTQAYSSLFSAFGLPGTIAAQGVTNAAFSPDGRLLVIITGQQVQLWDRATHSFVSAVPAPGGATWTAFNAGSNQMAVAEGNGTIQLWNIALPQRPVSVASIAGPAGPVQQVAFVSGGHTLAAAGWDHNVWVWDISDPAHPARLAVLPAGANVASSVASSPDGRLLASGDWDGSVHIWDMAGHRQPTLLAVFNDRQRVREIAFDPAGPFLAVGGDSTTGPGLHLWSITIGAKPRRIATIVASGPSVSALAFSPTAPLLAATGPYAGQTLLWNVADPARPAALPSLKGGSLCVAFSPDGKTLATLDQTILSARAPDNEVELWNVSDPENMAASATVDVPSTYVGGAAVTPDGRLLAIAGVPAGSVLETLLWDIADIRNPVAEPALRSPGTTVALARQGQRYLLATGGGGIVAIWDVTDPAHASYLGDAVLGRKGDTETNLKVAFSPDGEVLAALGSSDGNIWLWSLKNLRHIPLTGELHGAPDGLLTVGPGGRMLADTVDGQIVGAASQTTLWTRVDPRRPWQVTHLASSIAGATATALDPVAPILAAGGTDGVIRLWSVPSSGPPTPLITLSGTTAPQLTLVFSPEGNILASADSDGNIHLWDISDIHAPVTIGEFAAPAGSTLISVSQSADGAADYMAETTGGDGGFSTWDIDASTLTSRVCASSGDPITAAEWNQYVPGQPYSPPCAAGR